MVASHFINCLSEVPDTNMRGLLMLVSLLVYSTTFNISISEEDTCTEGNIRVIGLINDTAGRMEFCYNAEWRAVCANEWDMRDAKVVCRQMLNICRNQSAPSDLKVQVCTDSCFGSSTLSLGIRGFNCTGTEYRLIDCLQTIDRTGQCDEDAGFVCYKQPDEKITTECAKVPTEAEEHTTCPTCPERDCTCLSTGRDGQQKTDTDPCRALGGGLGTLFIVLILILVGVVIVWVWSCHRNRNKQQDTKFDTPTYDVTSSTPSPEDSWLPPTLTVETSATPPIYATVVKKTSKKQREQTHNVGSETVIPVTSASANNSTDFTEKISATPPIYATVNKMQRNDKATI